MCVWGGGGNDQFFQVVANSRDRSDSDCTVLSPISQAEKSRVLIMYSFCGFLRKNNLDDTNEKNMQFSF